MTSSSATMGFQWERTGAVSVSTRSASTEIPPALRGMVAVCTDSPKHRGFSGAVPVGAGRKGGHGKDQKPGAFSAVATKRTRRIEKTLDNNFYSAVLFRIEPLRPLRIIIEGCALQIWLTKNCSSEVSAFKASLGGIKIFKISFP